LLPGTELYYYKARVYHPKLGRFLQTDPIGYEDGMNWYAYVGNDPVNAIDPSGKAKVYTWNAGKIPGDISIAGHAAILTKDGTYLSMFPENGRSGDQAVFHSYEDDFAIYGREPDMIFDVGLLDEDAASAYAKYVKSIEGQEWTLAGNNCATVTTDTLNAGGTNLPTNKLNSPQQLDVVLGIGADAPNGLTAIPVVRVSGRLMSNKLKKLDK
jgi:hypothetical protein